MRIEAGRKRVVSGIRHEREQWQVLITEHHEGYIDWQTYEHNQRVIADNTNMKGEMARGALRKGQALLAGLLRCGHCGRKLHVGYTGKNGNTSRCICRGASINHGASGNCIAFGSIRIDQDVSAEVLHLLRPVGVEAALHAIEQCAGQGHASVARLSSLWSSRASRPPEHNGNSTQSIQAIDWLPASSSGDRTSGWQLSHNMKQNSRGSTLSVSLT